MGERIRCFFVKFAGYEAKPEGGERAIWWNVDTGDEYRSLADVPVGGMWYADWFDNCFNPQLGPGKNLVVKTPGGDWMVDRQSSNCTMPEDTDQEKHHCWVIHGTPPRITVDKIGVTCGAGAGSIMTANGKYHGFLRNGYLEEC